MKWLEQHRRERRWWASSATLAVLSLLLGVVGVVPVLASSVDASCAVRDGDALTVSWSGLPDGLELVLLAETADGAFDTVDTDNDDDVVGYGAEGSWTGAPYPGAVSYALYADATTGGGSVACALTTAERSAGDEIASEAAGMPRFGAAVAIDCSARTTHVEVSNDGSATGTATVDIDGDQQRVEVDAGSTAIASSALGDDGQPVSVTVADGSDGGIVLEESLLPRCAQPQPDLEASIDVVCQSGAAVVTVTITNRGRAAGSADVIIGETTMVTIAAGATETVVGTVAELGPVAVTVMDGAGELIGAYQANDVCASPAPELLVKSAVFCEPLEVEILAVNAGTADGVVYVEVDGVANALVVPAGGHAIHLVSVLEGATVRVVAHDGTSQLLDVTYEGVCEEPEALISADAVTDCGSSLTTVTVTNTGNLEGVATILLDGDEVASLLVAPGQSVDQRVAFEPSDPHVIVVRANGGTLEVLVVDVAVCTTPEADVSASSAIDCEAGTVTVDLINVGNAEGVADVTINGTTETVVVPAGGSVERTSPVEPGGSTDVLVVVDGVVLVEETTLEACVSPAAEIVASTVLDCASRQVVVRLENGGSAPGDATVTINGVGQAVTVPPGETINLFEQLAESGSYVVDVTVDDVSILSETRTGACAVPEGNVLGSVDVSCTSGGAMVIVSNGRNEETTVTITIDGVDDTFVVPAEVLYERHVALGEDEAYDISLSSGDAVLGAASGTFDCENPEVRAKTKKKEPEELTELPRTGAAKPAMLATAGAALVATGLVALRASAIRRERLVELRAD